MNKIAFSALIFLLAVYPVSAEKYYVSVQGSDGNPGSMELPFRTIQKAAGVMQPGDTCLIREGRYHERIEIVSHQGGRGQFMVFKAYGDEKVIMDGTEPIQSKWKKHKGNIYKTKLEKDIWQLFVNDKMMISARWPNGYWEDGSIWDKHTSWFHVDPRSRYGIMYGDHLANCGFDLSGAIGILNIGSFRTFARFIEHEKGRDYFNYPKDCWDRLNWEEWFVNKNKEGFYFLENKLEFLDSPTEWFFNPDSKILYLWAKDGKNPEKKKIRGKTLSYGFDISKSSYIRIDGLTFFGSTFRLKDCHHVVVEDCKFHYPSYSIRMLRDISPMDVTMIVTSNEYDPGYNIVRNCVFEYMDGPAIKMTGVGNLMENCYIHDVDYSCTFEGGWTIHMVDAPELTFRRNTVHTTGASELFKAGVRNLIELNDLSRSGYLQTDGSLVQVSVKQQERSITRYNWVHHSIKQGLRFDNSNLPNKPWGTHGTVHHNVAWETQRSFFKGDHHQIYHNLCFDNEKNDLIISANTKINGFNLFTATHNNVAGTLSGDIPRKSKVVPPGLVSHNWAGHIVSRDVRDQLRDPDNLDFRPKADSDLVDAGIVIQGINDRFLGKGPDIGPYEYGDVIYWIPGYQSVHASRPVPPDGANKVKHDADLMWLPGYKAASYDIYFATKKEGIEGADKRSSSYRGNQKNNIFSPSALEIGKTYYWRVDSVIGEKIIQGDVWNFTVE